MAASQRQLQRYSYLKEERNFYGFLLGKGFREKCKCTELALNFIQKQEFSPKKKHFPFIIVK